MSDDIVSQWPKLSALVGVIFGGGVAWGTTRREILQLQQQSDDQGKELKALKLQIEERVESTDCEKCRDEASAKTTRAIEEMEERVVKAVENLVQSSERRTSDLIRSTEKTTVDSLRSDLKAHSSVLKSLILKVPFDEESKDEMLEKVMR